MSFLTDIFSVLIVLGIFVVTSRLLFVYFLKPFFLIGNLNGL